MIVFIVVPNNKSLANYVKIALNELGNPPESRIVVCRGEDIPLVVEEMSKNGRNAVGLTGRDLLMEYELSRRSNKLAILKTICWNDEKAVFGKPALCILGPEGKNIEDLPRNLRVCINSKYKNLAEKYLNALEGRGYSFSKLLLSGSTESAYGNGLSDLVVDIVYTGASMRNASLKVYDKLLESDLVVIGVKDD